MFYVFFFDPPLVHMPRQSMNHHVRYVFHLGPRIGFGVTSKVWKCCRGKDATIFQTAARHLT